MPALAAAPSRAPRTPHLGCPLTTLPPTPALCAPQHASLRHFLTQPASALAVAAAEGPEQLRAALEAAPAPLLTQLRAVLGSKRGPADLAARIR